MPGKTADELAIRELTARFNHLDCQKRNSELAATFVENGVFVARDERFEGRPAIEAYFDTQQLGAPVNIGFGVTGRLGTTVHATTDNLITIEGDEATQLSFMMVPNSSPATQPTAARALRPTPPRADRRHGHLQRRPSYFRPPSASRRTCPAAR